MRDEIGLGWQTTQSIPEAAALFAMGAKAFRTPRNIYSADTPRNAHRPLGGQTDIYVEPVTGEGYEVAKLRRVWSGEDAEPDREFDDEVEKLCNHPDPDVAAAGQRLRDVYPRSVMRYLHAAFANQSSVVGWLKRAEPLVKLVRGSRKWLISEKPGDGVARKLGIQ